MISTSNQIIKCRTKTGYIGLFLEFKYQECYSYATDNNYNKTKMKSYLKKKKIQCFLYVEKWGSSNTEN